MCIRDRAVDVGKVFFGLVEVQVILLDRDLLPLDLNLNKAKKDLANINRLRPYVPTQPTDQMCIRDRAYHLPVLARLPIDPAVAEACDAGRVESLDTTELEPALQAILAR